MSEQRYLVTRARRGEWTPGDPHPGFDEFVDGKPTGVIASSSCLENILARAKKDLHIIPPAGPEQDAWFREVVYCLAVDPYQTVEALRGPQVAAPLAGVPKEEQFETHYYARFNLHLGTYDYGEQMVELPDLEEGTFNKALEQVEAHFKGKAKITGAHRVISERRERVFTTGEDFLL